MNSLAKSLQLLDRLLAESPAEELDHIFQKIHRLELVGPTIPQYFEDLQFILAYYQDSIGHPVDVLPKEFLTMFDYDFDVKSVKESSASFLTSQLEYTVEECDYFMAA